MTAGRDDYDVFLDTWTPSAILKFATLPSNVNDPSARQRLLDDSTGASDLTRTAFTRGMKTIDEQERALRRCDFFDAHQAEWSADFRDRVASAGIDADRRDAFVRDFATLWVDGRKRRQEPLSSCVGKE